MNQVSESGQLRGEYREDLIVPARLRQHERTARSLEEVARAQPGDILIVAAQTGWYQRGKPAHWARRELAENEFGLDTVALGSLILTHPDEATWWKQRTVNCLGDDLDPGPRATTRMCRSSSS